MLTSSLFGILKAVGSAFTAFFSWLSQRRLIKAGQDELLLNEANRAEGERHEREAIDERVRRMGDGTVTDELRRDWSRR